MPECGIHVVIYMLYVHNPGVHERFYRLDLKKEMIVLENEPWRALYDDEGNDCRFRVQREEHWIHI